MTHLGKKSGNLSTVPFDPRHAENDTTGQAFNHISPIFSNRGEKEVFFKPAVDKMTRFLHEKQINVTYRSVGKVFPS